MSKILIHDIGGAKFYGCECIRDWWPLVQALALKRDLVKQKLDVSQGGYNAGGVAASAGTHDGGGVLDLRQWSEGVIRLLREAGSAAHPRTPPHFSYHTHLVLVGCPHASAGAKRQVESYKAGRDGLAMNGPDTGPLVEIRTWSQGVAWMRGQLGDTPLTDQPTPTKPTTGESTPSGELSMSDIATIIAKLDRLEAIETENQKRITEARDLAKQSLAVSVENQKRLGWEARDESISKQIGADK